MMTMLDTNYKLFYGLTTMPMDEFLALPYEPVPSFWFTTTSDLENYFYEKYGVNNNDIVSPNDERLPCKLFSYGTVKTGVCQSLRFIIMIEKIINLLSIK